MLCKYRVESTEMLTGKHPVDDMECDGLALIGIVKDREGKPCEVCVRLRDLNIVDIACALNSNEHLKKAAIAVGVMDRHESNPLRRMFARLFGGAEHAQE